jgi:hypothetical protein
MQQEFQHANYDDADGNPAGGWANAEGIRIVWQDGPLAVDGVRRDPNGAFVETVIAIAKSRLEYYQSGKFASAYNASAIQFLDDALATLHQRTADREARGVEGTHEK